MYEREEFILSAIAQSITGNHKLKVVIGNHLGCTNGNTIFVGNDEVIDGTFTTKHDNFLMRLKLMVHETLHCVYTPFGDMGQEVSNICSRIYPDIDTQVIFSVFNMLEDIYIESQVQKVFGGWLLEGFKYGSEIAKKDDLPITDNDPFTEWFHACIQYRDSLNTTDKRLKGTFSSSKAKDVFDFTLNMFNKNRIQNPCRRMSVFEEICIKVMSLYNGNMPDIELSAQKNMPCGNTEEGEPVRFDTPDIEDSDTYTSDEAKSDVDDNNTDDTGTSDNADTSDNTDMSDIENDTDMSNSTDDNANSADMSDNGEDNTSDDVNASDEDNTSSDNATSDNADTSDDSEKDNILNGSEIEKITREATNFSRTFTSQEEVKVYESIRKCSEYDRQRNRIIQNNKSIIKTLESTFRKELKRQRSETLYGSSGRYDPLKAATDGHKTVNVFRSRRGEGEERDASILISLDESGSMDNGRKDNAIELIVSMVESLKSFREISIQVEGWICEDEPQINLYKSFSSKITDSIMRATEEKNSNTPLGFALEHANKVFANRRERNKVFFMVTDGYPDCWRYPEYQSKTFIKKEILKMKKQGVEPIVLVLGEEQEYAFYHELFGDSFVSVDSMGVNWVKKIAPKLKKAARNLV